MYQTVSTLALTIPLYFVTAVATHLVMSLGQTLMHYKLGHHPMGGMFFRNHIRFHHGYYGTDHLTSETFLNKGGVTLYFFIPISAATAVMWWLLPLDFFLVVVAAAGVSYCAHVLFDESYHVERAWLQQFAWFRRRQELHFVHHRHANKNFGVIYLFWDRLLGTYQEAENLEARERRPRKRKRQGT